MWPWLRQLGGSLLPQGEHLIYSTCIQNLATLASAIPEMIAGVKIENVSCDPDHTHFRGGLSSIVEFDTFYPCAKFDDFTLNRSRDITEAPKFKVGQVTLTTLLLRVICHQYAGTWHSLPVYKIWPL